jgi:protein-S-isoprenylcysteine O-methyltransferase Ste14
MDSQNNRISAGQIIFAAFYLLLFPALLLLLSGDWLWTEGWIFAAWFLSISIITIIYLHYKDPALLKERFQKPGAANQKRWDKYFVILLNIVVLIWLVIMPLDAKRFMWTTNFPFEVKIAGFIFLILAYFFLLRSYTDNTFISPLVRIQEERKQKVVSTGVYGFVRHPMYLGGILWIFGTPMLLGSLYGLLVGFLLTIMFIGRIFGEEKMLVSELEGYREYMKKVKWRLLPFIF